MAEAKDATAARLKRIEALVDEMESHLAKAHDVLIDIRRTMAGENPVGEAIGAWRAAWAARYHTDYTTTVADGSHFKRLLRTIDLQDLKVRMQLYMQSQEKFIVNTRHSLGLFVANINQFLAPDLLGAGGPPDCKHQPPCRTDAEHTQRRTREMQS
jgi:hypothetical protein